MSYYFRDKPRFSDRLRSDSSGDDLMESLKRQFDQDSKTFFEPTTSRTSRERETPFDHRNIGFSRGFPFDDDGFERRGNIRSHLDDLAARHPEFADQLLGPPWGDAPFLSTPRNRRRGSGLGNNYQNHPDDDTRSQASGSSAASAASGASGVSSHGEPEHFTTSREPHVNLQEPRKNPIPQYGLRNTVDIGQHRHNMENNDKMNRGQRSASAPPENRQNYPQQQQYPDAQQQQQQQQQQPPQNPNQRFVSRVDITPQQQQQGDIAKPPMSPKQSQPQQSPPQSQTSQQQKAQQQGNVRHIPIFVEGRDEPVVPKNVEEPIFPQQQQRPQSPPQFHRPSHFNQHFANSRQHQQWPPQYHQQQQFYQQPHQEQPTVPQQTQKPNHYQQQQQQYRQQQAEKQRAQQQQQQQQQQPEAEPAPAPKPKQIQPKEPLERVALVQKEVDSLMEQVKLYTGNSRQAKDYMYLDEMLTRELIKLDDIETEGKPNVRQARKDAIKSIQDCIALLESKVPLPGQEVDEKPIAEEEKSSPQMETDLQPAESEATDVSQQVVQAAPIPLPPAPSLEQNSTTEEPIPVQERTLSDEPMPTEGCPPLAKTASDTVMETQQGSNFEGQKRQAESSSPSLVPVESGSEQQMDVDSSTKATKSPRKERKTIPPKPVSEEPIPLPAPEGCHT